MHTGVPPMLKLLRKEHLKMKRKQLIQLLRNTTLKVEALDQAFLAGNLCESLWTIERANLLQIEHLIAKDLVNLERKAS